MTNYVKDYSIHTDSSSSNHNHFINDNKHVEKIFENTVPTDTEIDMTSLSNGDIEEQQKFVPPKKDSINREIGEVNERPATRTGTVTPQQLLLLKDKICGVNEIKDFLGIILTGIIGGILLCIIIYFVRIRPLKVPNDADKGDKSVYYNMPSLPKLESVPTLAKLIIPDKQILLPDNIEEKTVYITSPLDLHGITDSDHTVKVLQLLTGIPGGISATGRKSIKHLELSGPISQPWLNYLISSLNSIETLSINVDAVCSRFANEQITALLETIKLENLETLTAEVSHRCPILQWGFELDIPNLKTVYISQATLTKPYYQIFSNILNKTKDTIEGIEISESFICEDCDVTELQFDNLKYLKITKRVDKTPFWLSNPIDDSE